MGTETTKTMDTIHVLGGGAVGLPLAAHLAEAGRRVIAVRTSRDDVPAGTITVAVNDGDSELRAAVETISLSRLARLDGIIVVAAKSHANRALADALRSRDATGPIVIMQNGVGVERPFVEAGFERIYRCVLYVTSQAASGGAYGFRPVTSSPLGIVQGDEAGLAHCVACLSTAGFPFHAEADIRREVWKKAIINAAFNSICPLLDVDNGLFARDAEAAAIAAGVVGEGVTLAGRLGLDLQESELMDQLLQISARSDGQFISTLQDLRAGRPTEIESLNMEMVRIAGALQPPLELPRIELLGRLIRARSGRGEREP